MKEKTKRILHKHSRSMIPWMSRHLEALKEKIWLVMLSLVRTCRPLTTLSLVPKPSKKEEYLSRTRRKKRNSNIYLHKQIFSMNSLPKSLSKELLKSTVTPKPRSNSLSFLWNWPQYHNSSHFSSKTKITQNQFQSQSVEIASMCPYMSRS